MGGNGTGRGGMAWDAWVEWGQERGAAAYSEMELGWLGGAKGDDRVGEMRWHGWGSDRDWRDGVGRDRWWGAYKDITKRTRDQIETADLIGSDWS